MLPKIGLMTKTNISAMFPIFVLPIIIFEKKSEYIIPINEILSAIYEINVVNRTRKSGLCYWWIFNIKMNNYALLINLNRLTI